MAILTDLQIAKYAAGVGFRGNGLVMAVAIALAESGGDPSATNTAGNTPPSTDRGLWQINSHWHAEVPDSCAFSPPCAAGAAYRISASGTNWTPWSTFGNGAYKRFMQRATVAANGAQGGPGGTPPPSGNPPPPPGSGGNGASSGLSGYLGAQLVFGEPQSTASASPEVQKLGSDTSSGAVFGPFEWILAFAVMGGFLYAISKTRVGYVALYYGEALILFFLFATQYQFFKLALRPFVSHKGDAAPQGNTEFSLPNAQPLPSVLTESTPVATGQPSVSIMASQPTLKVRSTVPL